MQPNRVERAKSLRDGLSVRERLARYSREGFASIDPDDRDIRLKWLGLYTQRPEVDGHFMLRAKCPAGQLSARQARTLAELSLTYARNTADLTTRQNVQLHWIRIEDAPAILRRLRRVGLTTSGACGDTVRVVVGCPAAGLVATEIDDASDLVAAVTEATLDHPDFVNLPRKFKVSVGGCRDRCHQPLLNDVGLSALRLPDGRVVYDIAAGGGLSTVPKHALRLGAVAARAQVVDVVAAVAAIFREHGNRDNRAKARLKFLLATWGAPRFLEELEARLGYALERAPVDVAQTQTQSYVDHLGITPSKDPERVTVGIPVPAGRILGDRLLRLAELAERHGDGRLRLTNMQNVLVTGVPHAQLSALAGALAAIDLPLRLDSFRKSLVSCTGLEFCKLAVAETKGFARELVEWLDRELGHEEGLRINVNGCPNSCGQHWIADIGLQGMVLRDASGTERQAFQVFFGGVLGAAFAQRIPTRVPAECVKHVIARVVRTFRQERRAGERFAQYAARAGQERLRALVAHEVGAHLLDADGAVAGGVASA